MALTLNWKAATTQAQVANVDALKSWVLFTANIRPTADVSQCWKAEHDKETDKAIRVLAIITRKSPHRPSASSATEDFLSTAVEKLESSNLVHSCGGAEVPLRFLLKHIWLQMFQIVFDICNTTYDTALAHLRDYSNLAVVSIYFGRSEARTALANVDIHDKFNIESGKAVLGVKEYERVYAENVVP
ncbi:MAG: hypothetical protein FRX48_06240 [Lasallia pustulata]|uniref:Uncharacterized protein n=1 Tax=Lasallia pustulata TaxID=136370 RepID=A0A5M8PL66_9LECA|nr:MAG: hypothetical protein FRX48_06240 [Lasallia pustulata]